MWLWIPLIVGLCILYGVSYTLVRTSGDGRGALTRLIHPGSGGTQVEYGGDGDGGFHEAYGREAAPPGSRSAAATPR